MTRMYEQTRHMNYDQDPYYRDEYSRDAYSRDAYNRNAYGASPYNNRPRKTKGGLVALALVAALALGAGGTFCIMGLNKLHAQAPVATQTAAAQSTVSQASSNGEAAQSSASQNDGMAVKVSREGAIAAACDAAGAGGQAKGEAQNINCSDIIEGGGTKYYKVSFDLGDVHYEYTVDAIDGHASGSQSFNGTQQLLNDEGAPVEGTEQPVDA